MCPHPGWDSLLRSGIFYKRNVSEGVQRDGKPKRTIGTLGRMVRNFPAVAPYPVTRMEPWWYIAKWRWRWDAATQPSCWKPSSAPQWWSAGALSPLWMESTRNVPWWSQKTVSMISISVNGDANFFARGDECFQVMGAFFSSSACLAHD